MPDSFASRNSLSAETDNFGIAVRDADEALKQLPVQPIAVEVVRRDV